MTFDASGIAKKKNPILHSQDHAGAYPKKVGRYISAVLLRGEEEEGEEFAFKAIVIDCFAVVGILVGYLQA